MKRLRARQLAAFLTTLSPAALGLTAQAEAVPTVARPGVFRPLSFSHDNSKFLISGVEEITPAAGRLWIRDEFGYLVYGPLHR